LAASHILIVEDEPKLVALLTDYLRAASFATEATANGSDVVAIVKARPPALIILDLTLPGRDGIAICRDIRSFSDVPIIIVTARIDERDRLIGLGQGADDYVCKPFSPREVVARCEAILRRVRGPDALAAVGLTIDVERHCAEYRGRVLDLTVTEFRLLQVLAHSPGRVFSRQQLLDAAYEGHRIITDRTVDSHIKNLRRKLQTVSPDQEPIRSVYGVGYKLDLSAD
jgi:two-component system response regulator BaeR